MAKDKTAGKVLVVDDEQNIRRVLEAVLTKDGHTVITAENGRQAIEAVEKEQDFDLVITDLIMPDINGVELLEAVKKLEPELAVIMITAHGTIKSAVDAMRLGAFDYVTKPFDLDDIKTVASNAMARREMDSKEKTAAKKAPAKAKVDKTDGSAQCRYQNMVGCSKAMEEVFDMIERVKDSRASVLIRGESGTGKEQVARALHYSSIRADKPFVPVACVALSEQLLQSELFGHEKGSFTGAINQKRGRFELADTGTLFLDEIGDIPPTVQMMLLRVLQERQFERVGGSDPISVDIRLVTATNQKLEELVDEGKFREDLFYRLQVITITMPPLRDRADDIPQLVSYFANKYAEDNAKPIEGIDDKALDLLQKYSWPGNVRELENTIERALVMADPDAKMITPDLLPASISEIGKAKK